MPLVDTPLRAKRILPVTDPLSCAVQSSALDIATALAQIARACSSVNMVMDGFLSRARARC